MSESVILPDNMHETAHATAAEDSMVPEITSKNGNASTDATDSKLQDHIAKLSIKLQEASTPLKDSPSAGIGSVSTTRSIPISLPRLVSGNIFNFPQMIDGVYEAPYSFNDFREYIGKFYAEENLDFLRDIREYQKLAFSIFPVDSMIDFHDGEAIRCMGTTFVDSAKPFEMKNSTYASILSQLEELSAKIFTTYIGDESPREINILYSTKNQLRLDIEAAIMHPNIFAYSFHYVANTVHSNFFLKFLKHVLEEASVSLNPFKDADSNSVRSNTHSVASTSIKAASSARASHKSISRNWFALKSAITSNEPIEGSLESDKSSLESTTASKKSKPPLVYSGRGGRGGRG